MTRYLVFDNYDSFTYNLVHLVEKLLGQRVDVVRNDKLPLEKVAAYDKIILSPGPGIPSEAGLLLPLIKEYAATKSILGVCLGHQAIGEAFGGKLVNLSSVYHGVATPISVLSAAAEAHEGGKGAAGTSREAGKDGVLGAAGGTGKNAGGASGNGGAGVRRDLFAGLPETIEVGRYHSWVISDKDFPEELEVTATDEKGFIMGLRHKQYDVAGVQFHPESVLTPQGEAIIRNWLKY